MPPPVAENLAECPSLVIYIVAAINYPAGMKIMKNLCTCLSALLLAACSTLKPDSVSPAACPEPPAASCPICEIPEQQQLQCPEPQVIEKVVTVPAELPPMATTAGKMHLPIIGSVEWATVEIADIRMEARIDTGAETTSIHAENITLVEKDGKRYVRFSLKDPGSGKDVEVEERLRRKVLIKQSEDEQERRYVVKLWITLGNLRSRIDVTLTDRDFLDYPLLVGRNFLIDAAIVDVSRQHLLNK
jgi:hypothetical protein